MAGWVVWFLALTLVSFFGGTLWVPITNDSLIFPSVNFIYGFLMVVLGFPLGVSLAHFTSVLLRLPGAALLAWISSKDGNHDLRIRYSTP